MPFWILLAGAATIAVTVLLSWGLWAINAPPRGDEKRADGE